jgi:hypothetical protein
MFQRLIQCFHRPPDFIVGGEKKPYLLRWFVIPRNRFFNVYLHKFVRDDDDLAFHDHPWSSVAIVIRGAYIEHDDTGRHVYRAGAIRRRSATYRHRVELIDGQPCWTIFLTGRRVREWGFHCPQGWRHWREFTAGQNGEEIGKGCN